MILDKLRGHRTHILVFVCMIIITVRIVLMDDKTFLEALENYATLLIGVATVLLGSKAGEAMIKSQDRK